MNDDYKPARTLDEDGDGQPDFSWLDAEPPADAWQDTAADDVVADPPVAADRTVAPADGPLTITVRDRTSLLQMIPSWVRGALYIAYGLAGGVLLYAIDRGWSGIGAPELKLYIYAGGVLGLTAAGNAYVGGTR